MGQFGGVEGVGSLFRSGNTLNLVDSQPKKTPDPLAHTQMRQTDPLPEFPRQLDAIREHSPEDKEYGMRDVILVDPNGYILVFGQPLTESP